MIFLLFWFSEKQTALTHFPSLLINNKLTGFIPYYESKTEYI